jgi:cobalt-zinc-cadmium resistance protein CzcA
MFFDSAFTIPDIQLPRLIPQIPELESDPGYRYYISMEEKKRMQLKLAKQAYLPDINLEYFNGTNNYAGSRNYQGFEVGIGIPLFFGDRRSKVRAGQYSLEETVYLQQNYENVFSIRLASLTGTLESYERSIEYYEQTGRELSGELLRSAEKSYRLGEIDFFNFVQGVDRAVEMELDFLEQLFLYDQTVLEINYMSLY